MPLAAAGYGVLLGLGFTTFVLSYGVWALMGVSLALGDPVAGLIAGLGFGIGRAVPIVVLAPLADRRSGERACEAMAMRPTLLRGARAGDAAALLGVAVALLATAGTAGATPDEGVERAGGADPSVSGPTLAYERDGGRAIIEEGGERTEVPGRDPAVGGPYAAVVRGDGVDLLELSSRERLASVAITGVDALAVARDWLAVRARRRSRDSITVYPINGSGRLGAPERVASARSPSQLSRPAVDGQTIVYALSKRGASSLVAAKLGGGRVKGRRILSSKTTAYSGPSLAGSTVAYVETTVKRQSVRLGSLRGGKGRRVLRRRPGPPTLWTTALDGDRVYVTVVARSGDGELISLAR